MTYLEIPHKWLLIAKNLLHFHLDRAKTGCRTFSIKHKQVFENLKSDAHLPAEKIVHGWLDQMRVIDPENPSAVSSKFESFCRSNQQIGPKIEKANVLRFGHVMTRDALQDLCELNPTSAFIPSRKEVLPSAGYLLKQTAVLQKKRLHHFSFTGFQMWSIYRPKFPNNPFHRVSIKATDLRNRLGLGQVKMNEELIYFIHRLDPSNEPHVPTTCDAGLNEFFRPGGKTCPLNGKHGLPEAVHSPIKGENISSRIMEAE